MNEDNQNMSQQPQIPSQQETQPSVSQPTANLKPNNTRAVSGIFKIAFLITALISAWLLFPGFIGMSSADGWGGIATVLGWILLWGFSIAALLLTAFLRNMLPNKLVSLVYGSATGVIVALSLMLVIFVATGQGTGSVGTIFMFTAIYILATLAVLYFVRFLDGATTNRTGADATHIKKLSLLSLAIGLVLSLVVSWATHPDFRFDKKIIAKSAAVLEYEECMSHQDEESFDGRIFPDDPYFSVPIPQRFGFPVSWEVQGNLTNFSLYFFVLVPNWLVWSIAVYLLMSIWYRFKLRDSQNV